MGFGITKLYFLQLISVFEHFKLECVAYKYSCYFGKKKVKIENRDRKKCILDKTFVEQILQTIDLLYAIFQEYTTSGD